MNHEFMLEPNRAPRQIAVLVPCYNEELTITRVVEKFKVCLPDADIYVYDNNSNDNTIVRAQAAGAVVRTESHQGKGYVIRRMFADVEADVYLLVDGDDTYDATAAPALIKRLINSGLDLVNGARVPVEANAYRHGHKFGNYVLTRIVQVIFGHELSDMLSGYKVLSRRFVKSFPAISTGFEIETEITVHALQLRLPISEIETSYRERPAGSHSKLKTFRDGFRIVALIARLVKDERPLAFFGLAGLLISLLGIALGVPVVLTFLETGLVPRQPTAILSVGLVILGFMSIFAGIILDVVTKTRHEMKRLSYLAVLRERHG